MRVALVDNSRSFLPELPAYCDALERAGHEPTVVPSSSDLVGDRSVDLALRFGGLLLPERGLQVREVHEYHSASTIRPARFRNLLKSIVDGKPAGRIFLSEEVRSQFHFPRKAPYILRNMGASPELLSVRARSDQEVDIDLAYIGSFNGRRGLVATIMRLAGRGMRIAVAGSPSPDEARLLSAAPNVILLGRLASNEVVELLKRTRAGLNYVPIQYPFDRQTSTKVIEYLVAGLPVVSNRYRWIDEHSRSMGYRYLDAASVNLQTIQGASTPPFILEEPEIQNLLWPGVLADAGFVEFLEQCAT